MKEIKGYIYKTVVIFVIFTVLCGGIYTAAMTGIAQLIFSNQANGSIIEVDGKKYGSELLGQQFIDEKHMWGRIMAVDTTTFVNASGNPTMYGGPVNQSSSNKTYEEIVARRVAKIKAAHKKQGAIPVDLVTVSASGLDPHISVAAANYQVSRLVENTKKSEKEIRSIIEKYTDSGFLGYFGEKTVNVLKVNLALDGILK